MTRSEVLELISQSKKPYTIASKARKVAEKAGTIVTEKEAQEIAECLKYKDPLSADLFIWYYSFPLLTLIALLCPVSQAVPRTAWIVCMGALCLLSVIRMIELQYRIRLAQMILLFVRIFDCKDFVIQCCLKK